MFCNLKEHKIMEKCVKLCETRDNNNKTKHCTGQKIKIIQRIKS